MTNLKAFTELKNAKKYGHPEKTIYFTIEL